MPLLRPWPGPPERAGPDSKAEDAVSAWMTSHDVCRQHRRLFRPEQRSCGIGCPCPGEWKRGGYGHGGKGGMAGAGQGTCALRKAGSGKESPLFVTAGPRREDGDLSGGRRERQAGHGLRLKAGRASATRLGILAWLQHRSRRPDIAGTARPSFPVVWRDRRKARRRASPELLPHWGRAPCT